MAGDGELQAGVFDLNTTIQIETTLTFSLASKTYVTIHHEICHLSWYLELQTNQMDRDSCLKKILLRF